MNNAVEIPHTDVTVTGGPVRITHVSVQSLNIGPAPAPEPFRATEQTRTEEQRRTPRQR